MPIINTILLKLFFRQINKYRQHLLNEVWTYVNQMQHCNCKTIHKQHLKFVWHILLVEGIESYEFETFAQNVDRLVQLLGAQSDGVRAQLNAKKTTVN